MNTKPTIVFDETIQICTRKEFDAEVKQFRFNLVSALTRLELGQDKEVKVDFNRWHINTLIVVNQLTKMGYTTMAGQRGGDIYYLIIQKYASKN